MKLILRLFFSFNLKSILENGFSLSSDHVGNISETALQLKNSIGPWVNVPKESYTVSSTATSTMLEVNDIYHNSKFSLRLLIMDTNDDVTKIFVNSLDLSKLSLFLLFWMIGLFHYSVICVCLISIHCQILHYILYML